MSLEKIKRYRDDPRVNQSYLKNLISKKIYNEESLSKTKGNYIDMALTMDEKLSDHFVICDVARPSDSIIQICKKLEIGLHIITDLDSISHLIDEQVLAGYYENRSIESRKKSFMESARDWWNFKAENFSKSILTVDELRGLDFALNNCKTSDIWRKLSKKNFKFQHDFYWEIDGVGCKGLADMFTSKNDIGCEIDIKYTDASTFEGWVYIMRKLNYPFQKAFYHDGLIRNGLKEVKSFWLVVSRNFIKFVEVPTELLSWGRSGYVTTFGSIGQNELNKYTPGYLKALEMHKNLGMNLEPEKEWVYKRDLMKLIFKENENE